MSRLDELLDKPGIRTGGYSYSGRLKVGSENGIQTQVGFFDKNDVRQRPGGIYTVQFNIDTSIVTDPAYAKVNPEAVINWSTEGNSVKRKISVVDGTSISGACDTVSVSVKDRTTNAGAPVPPGTNQEYSVSILITPFPRPASGSPPFLNATDAQIVLVGGTRQDVPIPSGIGVTSVAVFCTTIDGAVPVAHLLTPFGTLASWTPMSPIWIPVLPQVTKVRVENFGAVGTHALFTVVYGIDG